LLPKLREAQERVHVILFHLPPAIEALAACGVCAACGFDLFRFPTGGEADGFESWSRLDISSVSMATVPSSGLG